MSEPAEDPISQLIANAPAKDEWGLRNTFGVSIASEIQVENVCAQYGSKIVLDNISFSIKPGEVLSLLGPSGSGKTTLLRILAGLEIPCGGRVTIDGKIMSDTASNAKVTPPEKRGIGLVFQDFALFPHLTILQNVKFGLHAMPAKDARDQARRVLSRVGLERYEKAYPHQLSGGEQQRVALARALAPRPGILLMDEPFSGLDARLRDQIREQTIELLRDTRSTVVIVTHDPEEALRVSDRIALMKNGNIVQYGSGHDLYYQPQSLFAATFFTELNQFDSVCENGRVETPIGSFKVADTMEGQEVTVCARLADVDVEVEQYPITKNEPGAKIIGRVTKRHFMGVVELLEIFLPGHPVPVKVRLKAGHLPSELNLVSLKPQTDTIMVFPRK